MSTKLLTLACVLLSVLACQKRNETTTTPVAPAPGKSIQLKFTGDITLSESPLGRQLGSTAANAKTLYDSTLYAVMLYRNGTKLEEGIFDQADSIRLNIPADGTIRIIGRVLKRGTGPGLAYTLISNGRTYANPLNDTLENKMKPVSYWGTFPDTLNYFKMAYDTGDVQTYHAEMDTYVGETTFDAATAPPQLSLPVKRIVFGVQFSADNFTGGRLIVYTDNMRDQYFTPTDISTRSFIITADEFRFRDSLTYRPVRMEIRWEKPDRTIVPIGQRTIGFKRNILTKIHLTLPAAAKTALLPVGTDTAWIKNETINF